MKTALRMNMSQGSVAVGLSIGGNNYIMHISDDLPHNSRWARITYRWDDVLARIHSLYLHQDFLPRLALKNKLQDKGWEVKCGQRLPRDISLKNTANIPSKPLHKRDWYLEEDV